MSCKNLISFLFLIGSFTSALAQAHSKFEKADSIATSLYGKELRNLKELSDLLTTSLQTDVEKFRSIYRWVSENLENDYYLYKQNKVKRERWHDDKEKLNAWNDKFTKKVNKRLFEDKVTVCTGYAYILKELCYHAGLECEMIDGYGRSVEANIGGPGFPNHTWNAVKLEGQWYLCDPTWSSGGVDAENKKFLPEFSDAYFLASAELFALNHYPLDTSWLLVDEPRTLEEFLNAPLIYKGALKYAIELKDPNVFDGKCKKGNPFVVSFTCPDDDLIFQISLDMINGSNVTNLVLEIVKDESGNYSFEHTFRSSGNYVFHLRYQDEYIVTFKVAVTR